MIPLPNHEDNYVVVIGEPAKIKAFLAEAFVQPGQPFPGDGDEPINTAGIPLLNFHLIVPQPENIEKGGCSGQHAEGEVCWYTWNLENWGTKWGAYNHDHFQVRWLKGYGPEATIHGRVDLTFQTAWSQPTPILAAIEERWGVQVHALTQDEGGFPDVEYGDPYGEEVIRKVVSFEFDAYEQEVPEPAEASNA